MKRLVTATLCISLLFTFAGETLATENQYAIKDGFLTGSIMIDEVEFKLDALFDDNMATPLREILVVPPPITVNEVRKKLEEHFRLATHFDLADSRAGWFQFATNDGYNHASLPTEAYYHKLVPTIADDGLRKAVEQCKAFLDDLGVEYYPVPTYAVYGNIQDTPNPYSGTDWESTMESNGLPLPFEIRFANSVDGMAIDPMAAGGKRDPQKIRSDQVMTDNAYTTFTFWETGELAQVFLYTFEVADSYPVEDPIITWQDALSVWYKLHHEEDALKYFEGSELCVVRIQAVWLTTYNNILRPGWYLEIQGRDWETGTSKINNDGYVPFSWFGVDAVTGSWE